MNEENVKYERQQTTDGLLSGELNHRKIFGAYP